MTSGVVVLDLLSPTREAEDVLREIARAIGRPRIVPDAQGKVTVWSDDIDRDRERIDDVLARMGDFERRAVRPHW